MDRQMLISQLKNVCVPFTNMLADYEYILAEIGDAHIVLLGEATHGTKEFYEIRAQLSMHLIQKKGFHAIAIEGDWPDAYHINRFIHDTSNKTAAEALKVFDRFPSWMWRNASIESFIAKLRVDNQKKSPHEKVSFFGLDLYSLYRSIDAVIHYLEQTDPVAAQEAREYYACLDTFRDDPQMYGFAVATQKTPSCEHEVITQLLRLQQQSFDFSTNTHMADEYFYAEQNARVVKNAEKYYRSLFFDDVHNWNIRDSHMVETLNELRHHLQKNGIATPKIIVWAHNSHIGNAAATEMTERGEYNIGQLVKEQYGTKAFSLGFTTYQGTVSAASEWHGHVERKVIRKALPDSYEALFHELDIPNFIISFKDIDHLPPLLERAIGVIYLPQTERLSHYFKADISHQFDLLIHYDMTSAVEPLEKTSEWIEGEAPETYPTGL